MRTYNFKVYLKKFNSMTLFTTSLFSFSKVHISQRTKLFALNFVTDSRDKDMISIFTFAAKSEPFSTPMFESDQRVDFFIIFQQAAAAAAVQ